MGPWDTEEGLKQLPTVGSLPYAVDFTTITDPIVVPGVACCGYGYIAPLYNLSNNVSWIKGSHAFKGGVEVRFVSSAPFSAFEVMPRAIIGAGGHAGIGSDRGRYSCTCIERRRRPDPAAESQRFPDRASIRPSIRRRHRTSTFSLTTTRSATGSNARFSLFFKDDFKITPGVTLNLGAAVRVLRCTLRTARSDSGHIGRVRGLFGHLGHRFRRPLSAVSCCRIRHPHSAGRKELAQSRHAHLQQRPEQLRAGRRFELVAFRISAGTRQRLRMGYSVGYERSSLRMFNIVVGDQPGLRTVTAFRPGSYLDLTRLQPAARSGREAARDRSGNGPAPDTIRGFRHESPHAVRTELESVHPAPVAGRFQSGRSICCEQRHKADSRNQFE